MYKKLYKIFGLIYIKINLLNSSMNIRVFGIKILSTKVDILKSTETWYLNIFRAQIKVYIRSMRKNIQNNYREYIINKYPAYDNYIIFSSGFGEIVLFLLHLPEFINKQKDKKTLIIFHRKSLQHLYKMFKYKYKSTVVESIEGIMLDNVSKYKGRTFITPLNFDYFGIVEKKIIHNKEHYFEHLMNYFKFNLNKISLDQKLKVSKTKIKNKNTVIILPEASTLEQIPFDFFQKLAKKLYFYGFDVIINTNNPFIRVDNCFNTYENALTIEDILSISKSAKAIVGVRSGFLEILAAISKQKTYVLYEKFNKFAQNKLSANDVMTGFSLKKYPNIDTNLIQEYNYENYREDFLYLIDNIVSDIIGNFQ